MDNQIHCICGHTITINNNFLKCECCGSLYYQDEDQTIYLLSLDDDTLTATIKKIIVTSVLHLKLPHSITYNNQTYVINKIDKYVLDPLLKIVSITIPSTIEEMVSYAFSNNSFKRIFFEENSKLLDLPNSVIYKCNNLETLTLPDGLKYINSFAISGCIKLKHVSLPNSLVYLSDYAFYNCEALEYNIYEGIDYLGNNDNLYLVAYNPFEERHIYELHKDCRLFTEYTFDDKQLVLAKDSQIDFKLVVDNLYYFCFKEYQDDTFKYLGTSFNNHLILKGPINKKITTGQIPQDTKAIADKAFINCESLKEIIIPNSVSFIGFGVFQNCSSLVKVTLPSHLSSIEGLFIECLSLEKITLPNSLTAIGFVTFNNCLSLKEIVLPKNIKEIHAEAFKGCESLKKIAIPEGVTSINYETFKDCSSLEEIILPNSLTLVGKDAFLKADNLKYYFYDNVKYLGNKENNYLVAIKPINQDIVSCKIHPQTKIIADNAFEDCSLLQEIILPNSLRFIGQQAFKGCRSIKEVVIPSGTKFIGQEAFLNANDLETLIIPQSVTTINQDAFIKEERLQPRLTIYCEYYCKECVLLQNWDQEVLDKEEYKIIYKKDFDYDNNHKPIIKKR